MGHDFPLYLALVHGPVKNKQGEEVTTSVTNLDIHDIARSCKTFGIQSYFIVTAIERQKALVGRILAHWNRFEANQYNPDRQKALGYVQLKDRVEEVIESIERKHQQKPLVVATGANFKDDHGDVNVLVQKNKLDKRPILLLFGTGWGLSASVCRLADFCLEPIFGADPEGYNHLSVRSAVAIYCDRLHEASGPSIQKIVATESSTHP